MPYTIIVASQMQLGDTVTLEELEDRPFAAALVKQMDKDEITLFRPYGVCADFSYTGGVICYIGVEEYKIPRGSATKYHLWNRKDLK